MVILETIPEPKVGGVRITLDQWVDVRISAEDAREKVHWWLFDDVNMMICAESPTFIIGERPVWRVPAIFYSTAHGRVGEVGTIDVDVITGEILADADETIERFAPIALKMAKKLPPYKPPVLDPLPDKYKSDRFPPAKVSKYLEQP